MNCADLEQLLDPFLDTELPPPMLLAVARHAASCGACDEQIRVLSELRESVARVVEEAASGIDLAGVWPAVSQAIDRTDHVRIRALRRRALPILGSMVALAASVLIWFGVSTQTPQTARKTPPPATAVASNEATAARPTVVRQLGHTYIDRLSGKGIALRHEPKSGTPVIWVNHTTEGPVR